MWKTFKPKEPSRDRVAPRPTSEAQQRLMRDFEVIVAGYRAIEFERELRGRPLSAAEMATLQERVAAMIHERGDRPA